MRLDNVVASCNLGPGLKLDLEAVTLRATNVDMTSAANLRLRLHKLDCVATLTARGRLNLTGAKSEAAARRGCRQAARLVQRLAVESARHKPCPIREQCQHHVITHQPEKIGFHSFKVVS